MGIVRRHPFLTALFVLGSLPALGLVALELRQNVGACEDWRMRVEARLLREWGPGPAEIDWDGNMGVPHDELREGMRDQIAHEMRAGRPPFCRAGG